MDTSFNSSFFVGMVLDFLNGFSSVFILAFGLYIVYGLFKVINMAHGEMVMLGAYVASVAQDAGYQFFVAVLFAGLCGGIIALAMNWLCIRHLPERSSMSSLLATWGFGLIIAQSVRLYFGSAGRFVDPPVSGRIGIFGVPFPCYQAILLLISLIFILLSWWILSRTQLGLRIRASIDNPTLAELNGINTQRLFVISFMIGGAFAGIAGALLAPISAINPTVGSANSVTSFLVVITGGIGQIFSILFGSVVVGGLRSIINSYWGITSATLGMLTLVALILVFRKRNVYFD